MKSFETVTDIAVAVFLIHRKDFVVVKRESVASYESKKPSGQDAHLADKKLVVNDTARARRISQARFFVLCTNISSENIKDFRRK